MNRLSVARKNIYNRLAKKTELFREVSSTEVKTAISEDLALPLIKLLHSIYVADVALRTG